MIAKARIVAMKLFDYDCGKSCGCSHLFRDVCQIDTGSREVFDSDLR